MDNYTVCEHGVKGRQGCQMLLALGDRGGRGSGSSKRVGMPATQAIARSSEVSMPDVRVSLFSSTNHLHQLKVSCLAGGRSSADGR